MRLFLRYELRRARCHECGVVAELVPWAAPGSWFTHDFEQTTAYLAQRADKTTVAKMQRIAWRTVGDVVLRVVEAKLPEDLLANLTHIGIDELSYRRHHEYLTVVIDHRSGRVVWARKGKSAGTLREFFAELGPERCAKLAAVSIDMSNAYFAAVTEAAPQAQIVFDRFHVQRLVHDAVDEVRRAQVREAEAAGEEDRRRGLKNTRFALQKSRWNLSWFESAKLSLLQRVNRPLYRAYLLKEALIATLDRRQPNVARHKLREWCNWAARSRLAPFRKLARSMKRREDGIIAYVASRLTNARNEGMNGKVRTITRRSFGFHDASSLIALIHLCCSGIDLEPAHR